MSCNNPTDEKVRITSNEKVNEKYFKLTFEAQSISRHVEPGHFMHVKIEDGMDPYLRRPFSYYRSEGNRVEVLYEILGHGTDILSRKAVGDEMQVLGALGKPFTQDVGTKKRVLIAGGVGVPPLVYLAEKVGADYLLIGTKSQAEVLPESELKNVKCETLYSTDDGSFGVQGRVTVLLEQILEKEKPQDLFIQTCGPMPMMEAVIKIANDKGIEGEASLDETMGCATGVCLGCMVKTPEGWVPSCKEGPVFSFDKLVEMGR